MLTKWVMLLAENLENTVKCKHRICLDKYRMGKTQTFIQAERESKTVYRRNVLSFSVSEVFATAKVKLLCSEVCATHK